MRTIGILDFGAAYIRGLTVDEIYPFQSKSLIYFVHEFHTQVANTEEKSNLVYSYQIDMIWIFFCIQFIISPAQQSGVVNISLDHRNIYIYICVHMFW